MKRIVANKLTNAALRLITAKRHLQRRLFWKAEVGTPGESVGLFLPLPNDLADQYPMDGKAEEDPSPPHLTLMFVGDVDLDREEELRAVCAKLCASAPSLTLSLKEPTTFNNDDGQTIIHSPVDGSRLHDVNAYLKAGVKAAGFEISDKYPDYKPHVTIEYVDEGATAAYADLMPEGTWEASSAQLWGLGQNYELPFASKG